MRIKKIDKLRSTKVLLEYYKLTNTKLYKKVIRDLIKIKQKG